MRPREELTIDKWPELSKAERRMLIATGSPGALPVTHLDEERHCFMTHWCPTVNERICTNNKFDNAASAKAAAVEIVDKIWGAILADLEILELLGDGL